MLEADTNRTLYRFDVRDEAEYAAGHLAGFRHYPGGQLVQEIDMAAPVRGARTSDRALVTAVGFARRIGKTPVVVRDAPAAPVPAIPSTSARKSPPEPVSPTKIFPSNEFS